MTDVLIDASSADYHNEETACFARTPAGEVFIVNGIDRGRKWSGAKTSVVVIGLDAPSAAPSVSESGGGASEQGTYYVAYRFGDADGNYSNLSPLAEVATTASAKSFSWSSVAAASGTDSSARITKRQLFRSLVGDATTLYLVHEIADNSTTTYSDTLSDADLSANEELPILNFDETLSANRFGLPPTNKKVAVWHQDRMFYLADGVYATGTVSLTNSSTTLTGSGTLFNKYMVGRFVYPVGSTIGYRISAYSSATSMTLEAAYSGTNLTGVAYEIRVDPAERNLIYFSEPEEPESVPQSQNQFLIQENTGEYDEIVGAYPSDTSLYILMRSHTYVFNYVRQPHLDGSSRLMMRRGAYNQRCWDRGGESVFVMDRSGPYEITGDGFKDIGQPIKNYWRDGLVLHSQSERFFVAVDPTTQVARFYVAINSDASVLHCFAYNYGRGSWELEEYVFPVGCAVASWVGGARNYYVGKANDRFAIQNYLASVDGGSSVTTGVVNTYNAGTGVLTATTGVFTSGLTDYPLVFTSGGEKGTALKLTASDFGSTTSWNSSTGLDVSPGDTFAIGAIPWRYKTGLMTYARNDHNNHERSIGVMFKPTTATGNSLDIRHYLNYKSTPEVSQFDQPEQYSNVAASVLGSPDGVVTLDQTADPNYDSVGYSRKVYSGRNAHSTASDRYISAELRGIAKGEPIEISQIDISGSK